MQKRLAIGGRPPCGEPDEPSHRVAAAGADDHAPPVVRVAEQRRLDDRGGISGISPDEREVLLAEPLRLQLSSERQMRDVILRDDEHAARVLVEPMHDPGTRRRAAGLGHDASDDRVHQRAGRVTVCGVHDQPRGLVHHDHILVLEEDVERDVLCGERERRRGVRDIDDELLSGAHPVGWFHRNAVDQHTAILREPRDGAAGKLAVRGEEAIHALAAILDANGDPLGHPQAGLVADARRSSSQSAAVTSTIPTTMEESATLNAQNRMSPTPTSTKSTT